MHSFFLAYQGVKKKMGVGGRRGWKERVGKDKTGLTCC